MLGSLDRVNMEAMAELGWKCSCIPSSTRLEYMEEMDLVAVDQERSTTRAKNQFIG